MDYPETHMKNQIIPLLNLQWSSHITYIITIKKYFIDNSQVEYHNSAKARAQKQ